jgi:hypothetical protein
MSDIRKIYDNLNEADRLYEDWHHIASNIYELRLKLENIQHDFNESLKKSVDMQFSSEQIARARDFYKYSGFSHPKVKEFLTLLFNIILPQERLAKTEWAKDLQLVWFNGNYSAKDLRKKTFEMDSSHFLLQLINSKTGLSFTINCPIVENTYCKMQDPDMNAGKYVIKVLWKMSDSFLSSHGIDLEERNGFEQPHEEVLVARLSNSAYVFDVVDKIMSGNFTDNLNDAAYWHRPNMLSISLNGPQDNKVHFSQTHRYDDDVKTKQDELIEKYQYFISDSDNWRTEAYPWDNRSFELAISHVIEDRDFLKKKAEDGRKQ